VFSLETLRQQERENITTLLRDIFAFHERRADHALSSIHYGGIPIMRTREGEYFIYGVDNALYFASKAHDAFHEHLNDWFPYVLNAAREDGLAPCHEKGFQLRPRAQHPSQNHKAKP